MISAPVEKSGAGIRLDQVDAGIADIGDGGQADFVQVERTDIAGHADGDALVAVDQD